MTIGQVLQSAGGAVEAGGFDRADTHVAHVRFALDEQGWEQLSALLGETLAEAGRIQERSNKRRARRDAAAVQPSQLAILHFASGD